MGLMTGASADSSDTSSEQAQTGRGTEGVREQRTATLPSTPQGGHQVADGEAFDPARGLPGYVVTHRLGVGSYGQVWQAVRLGAGQDVAVKIFTSPARLDWRYLQREVDRLLRVAEHPHIVTLLDANLQHDPPFYAMTLLRAGSLEQFCHKDGRLEDYAQAAHWFEQIVRALEFAHGKGLLHCDLKPANVLLDEENNVRLADFGQSHLRGEAARTLGTLNYMAPEQAVVAGENQDPPGPSVSWDIYSLGATIYSLLTGQPPHSHADFRATLTHLPDLDERLQQYRQHLLTTPITPIRSLNPRVDRDLADIVEHCLEPDPQQRYHHVAEIATDLRRRREQRPLRCHPRAASYVFGKFLKRNFGMVVVTIAAVIALATVSATLYLVGSDKVARLQSDLEEAQRLKVQAEADRDQIRQEAFEQQMNMTDEINPLEGEPE